MNLRNFYCVPAVLLSLCVSSVYAAPGDGIGGVEVGMRKKPGEQKPATTRTDAQGHFTFANLAAGDYGVSLLAPVQGNPMAKSFFESRSNTVRLKIRQAGGAVVDLAFVWNPATNAMMAASSNLRMATAQTAGPGEAMFRIDRDGGSVQGQLTAAASTGTTTAQPLQTLPERKATEVPGVPKRP